MRRRTLLFLIAIILSISPALSQQSLKASLNAAPASIGIRDTTIGKFYYGKRNAPPRAIVFNKNAVTSSAFLSGINQFLDVPSEFSFLEIESNTDYLGIKHRLIQQHYKGIPLEGMEYKVHEKDGFITSANGRAVRSIRPDIQVTISEEQAFHLAVKHLNSKDTIFRPARKLIVSKGFTFTPESFSVAFQFDIDVSLVDHWRVSIDARNGDILNKVSLVNSCGEEPTPPLPYGTGTGSTNYYGNKTIQVEKFSSGSSRLIGQTLSGGKIGTYDFQNVSILSLTWFYEFHKAYEFHSGTNTYFDPYHKPAVSVQWAAEQAYEYYFKKHNRNSFDNNGSLIKSYVHVDRGLNNAFWTHNLLAFGDGSDNNPLVELDIVAHELTHGVTQFEAGLQYYNEPGALNESFSDILGKAVEFETFGDTATWQIARRFRAGGIRDLSNPNLKGQPDTYAGDLWYTGVEDSGGVHYNSGVQNYWFYLLCEGGSGVNDHQSNYTVNPIGLDAAVKIAYRNLTEYLIRDSDYLDSRLGSLLAAADLFGSNSAIYREVENAWDAVGVVDEPIITDLNVYDITGTTAKLKGNLLPRGNIVEYRFEYGTTPALGSSSQTYYYTNTVEGILTGLQSETKYFLRLVATNENGSSFYSSEFTTISLDPLVKLKHTVDVTETSATLFGLVNPNSLPTAFYFEYGLTPALELTTQTYHLSADTKYLEVAAPLINLQPRQTYYYRLVATNAAASASTESFTFYTAAKPVIHSYTPVTAPVGAEIRIVGENFNRNAEKNLISFGATQAEVLVSNTSELTVKVPVGASLAPISILDSESGLTAESVQDFVPTFTGEFRKGDMQLTMGSTDYIYQTLVQDMDGDNKPDIVARHYLGFSIFQNVNQGGDISDESFIRSTFNSENTPEILSLVDFDGNGLKDIVARYPDGLRIYPNSSVPGYVFFGPPAILPLAGYDFAFSDFDLDGHIDIAAAENASDNETTFVILRNQNPKGVLSVDNFNQRYQMNVPYYVRGWYSDDFNNDGKPDLLAASYNKTFLPFLINKSHPGTLNFEESNVESSITERYPFYFSQDFNKDGWKDIISHSSSQNENIYVIENKRSSPNITMEDRSVLLSGSDESVIHAGDLNGDGKIDVLVGKRDGLVTMLKNNTSAHERISGSSFEYFEEFGSTNSDISSQTSMTISDLNGDGRPEVINTYSYNRFPHEGYQMEIWQNSPNDCPDPSLTSVVASRYTATIVLPSNTTFDQFEIEYAPANSTYWSRIYSTTLTYLSPGYSYKVRVRARCHLGFTRYHLMSFTTDCVDMDNLLIKDIGVSSVRLESYEIGSFEIQYSPAGESNWTVLPQYVSQITDLVPGTTYDLRLRGRCYQTTEFKFKQFTTLCPKLSSITTADLTYNQARVNWTSNYSGAAVFEYSVDNVAWDQVDENLLISNLIPGKKYIVRGRLQCTDINSDFIETSFTTPCPTVSYLSAESITPFSAIIKWKDESDTRSYTLSYSVAPNGNTTELTTTSTSFLLDGLLPGTTYTVSVAPQCLAPKKFASINFNTICYTPFNLSASNVTHTNAELSWDDTFSGQPYTIDYSILNTNVWIKAATPSKRIVLDDLRPGTIYEARVHINCTSQTAPFASVIFETSLYQETSYAPNPTDSKTIIYPSQNLIGHRYIIYDNVGRNVAHGRLSSYIFDLTFFPPGVYTLHIDGENPMRVVKK